MKIPSSAKGGTVARIPSAPPDLNASKDTKSESAITLPDSLTKELVVNPSNIETTKTGLTEKEQAVSSPLSVHSKSNNNPTNANKTQNSNTKGFSSIGQKVEMPSYMQSTPKKKNNLFDTITGKSKNKTKQTNQPEMKSLGTLGQPILSSSNSVPSRAPSISQSAPSITSTSLPPEPPKVSKGTGNQKTVSKTKEQTPKISKALESTEGSVVYNFNGNNSPVHIYQSPVTYYQGDSGEQIEEAKKNIKKFDMQTILNATSLEDLEAISSDIKEVNDLIRAQKLLLEAKSKY